jgi:fumarate hydratase subunit beta
MKVIELTSPLSESTARSLKTGDLVSLSGDVITARDEAHLRALGLHRKGATLPFKIEGRALYHCGPIMLHDRSWKVVAAGPTTSARMDSLAPELIRAFRPRLIIGKGGMSSEVLKALSDVGCAYLAFTGGAAVLAAEGLPEVLGVHWEDLGMAEAVWLMRAEGLGPMVVAMDSHGRSIFQDVETKVKKIASGLI